MFASIQYILLLQMSELFCFTFLDYSYLPFTSPLALAKGHHKVRDQYVEVHIIKKVIQYYWAI